MVRWLLVGVLMCAASPGYAWQVANSSGHSAEHSRMLSRNASLDADAAFYNPAGTTSLDEGFTLLLVNQAFYLNTVVTHSGEDHIGAGASFFYPTAALTYRQDAFAVFVSMRPLQAGGLPPFSPHHPELTFRTSEVAEKVMEQEERADVTTLYESSVEGVGVALGMSSGLAYQLSDWVSFSLEGIFVIRESTFDLDAIYAVGSTLAGAGDIAEVTIDVETTGKGTGFTGVLGMHLTPTEGLEIGLRYQHRTTLRVTYTTEDGRDDLDLFPDGSSHRYDVPGILSLGVSYDFAEGLMASISGNFFFVEQARWGKDVDGVPIHEDYVNGLDVSVGAEWAFMDSVAVSVGYRLMMPGATPEARDFFEMALNSHTFATGVVVDVWDFLKVNLGASYKLASPGTNAAGDVDYDWSVINVGLGVAAHFDPEW